jgi:hypothetical protein
MYTNSATIPNTNKTPGSLSTNAATSMNGFSPTPTLEESKVP